MPVPGAFQRAGGISRFLKDRGRENGICQEKLYGFRMREKETD